jgi:hypothetical protein
MACALKVLFTQASLESKTFFCSVAEAGNCEPNQFSNAQPTMTHNSHQKPASQAAGDRWWFQP